MGLIQLILLSYSDILHKFYSSHCTDFSHKLIRFYTDLVSSGQKKLPLISDFHSVFQRNRGHSRYILQTPIGYATRFDFAFTY